MKPLRILLTTLLFLGSCNRFYAPVKASGDPSDAVKKYFKEGRTFILHDSSFTYLMANMTLENNVISTLLICRDSLKSKYQSSQSHLNYHYTSRLRDTNVINQIHLFTFRTLTRGDNVTMSIPVSDVKDVQELKFDKNKTTQNRLIGVLAGIVLVGTAVSIAGLYSYSNL